jgi:hypothetical protein
LRWCPPARISGRSHRFIDDFCLGEFSCPKGHLAFGSRLSQFLKTASTESQESFPLQSVFISFWAALDGRALSSLDRATASKEFVSSLLECIRLAVRRLSSDRHDLASLLPSLRAANEAKTKLVHEHTERLWREVTSKRLKIEEQSFAKLLSQHLKVLSVHAEGSLPSTCVLYLCG